MRHKADAFEAISSFLVKGEYDHHDNSLLRINMFKRWRRRFLVKHDLRKKLQFFSSSIKRVSAEANQRYLKMGAYFLKLNVQEWRLKAAMCKAVLERQDFRRIRAFKILHNFSKLGRLFFKVVLGCVLRKEHLHRQVFFIKLKLTSEAYEAETKRMAVGALDVLRIQKAAAFTKLEKPIMSLFSKGLSSFSSAFLNLRNHRFSRIIQESATRTEKALGTAGILKSKLLKNNPVLYSLVSANLIRKASAASKVLTKLVLKVLRKANEEENKKSELLSDRHAVRAVHCIRSKTTAAFSNLLLDKRSEYLLDSLAKRKELLKDIDSSTKRHSQIESEIFGTDHQAISVKKKKAIFSLGVRKLQRAWSILMHWRYESELREIRKEKAARGMTHVFKNLVSNKYEESVRCISRTSQNSKKVDKFRKAHNRRIKKASFCFWKTSSKKAAKALRTTFAKICSCYSQVARVAFKKLRTKVVAERCKDLLDEIEVMNEEIADSNQKLLEQTQENFQLENDLRYRSVRSQRSLIKYIIKASENRKLLEMRMCLFHMANFSNFVRRSTYLLTAVSRTFTKNCSSAFYTIEREAINDLERFLVQAVKNFRDETAEQMIEREDLNQQTLSFVEERANFEVTDQNLARRLKAASQKAALKAISKAKLVEEQAVMKMRLQMWRGRTQRLEILRAYVDHESRQFADRKHRDYLYRWHNQIVKGKKFKLAYERLIHFVRHVERNHNSYSMRMIADRFFQMEQFHLGKLIDQANKKIYAATAADLRSKIAKMSALVIRLIESRKFRLYERFFEATIYSHKKKLIAETKVMPLEEKKNMQLISETFKHFRKKFKSTQVRNKISERTAARQKLFLLKLLQMNIACRKQVKMACRYLQTAVALIEEDRAKLALTRIVQFRAHTSHQEKKFLGSMRLFTALGSISQRQALLYYSKVFRSLTLPKKTAVALGTTLGSLIRRKLGLSFAILKAGPPNDNLIGRYIIAKYRWSRPIPKHELLSKIFKSWKKRSVQASSKLKAAQKVVVILDKSNSPARYLQRWYAAAQMEGMLTARATTDDILKKYS